MLAEPVTTTIH